MRRDAAHRTERTRAWITEGVDLVGFARCRINRSGLRSGLVSSGLIATICMLSVPALLVLSTMLASMAPAPWDVVSALAGLIAMAMLVVIVVARTDTASCRPVPESTAKSLVGNNPTSSSWFVRWVSRLVVFTIGAFIMMGPAGAHLATRYPGEEDTHYWFWMSWRTGQAIRHGQSILHYPDLLWPYGLDIRAADGFIPTLVGGLWSAVVPNPVLAYNLAIATALVSTALAGAWLASRVTAEHWVHVVTGLALMTATLTTVRVNMHYNLLFTFPAVLLVGRAVEIAAGDRVRIGRDGLLIAVAYLSSGYFMAYGVIAAVLIVVISNLGSWSTMKAVAARGVMAMVVCLVVLSPFLVAKLRLEHAEASSGAAALSDESAQFSADPFSLFQSPNHTLGLPGPLVAEPAYDRYEQEATTFPGLVLLGGLVAMVCVGGRLRRPVLLATAALWLLSLGPRLSINDDVPIEHDWLPSALLTHLPGMRGMRDPDRAAFLILPIAGLALALCLHRVSGKVSGRHRQLAIVLACVAMVVGIRFPVAPGTESPAAANVRAAMRTWGASDAPGAVLILPDQCTYTLRDTRLQIDLRRPMVGCQGFSAALPFASGLDAYRSSDAWAALRCIPAQLGRTVRLDQFDGLRPSAEAIADLRPQLGVGLVVFDRNNRCPEIAADVLDLLQHNARQLADDGRFALFEIPSATTTGTTTNVEGHP